LQAKLRRHDPRAEGIQQVRAKGAGTAAVPAAKETVATSGLTGRQEGSTLSPALSDVPLCVLKFEVRKS
jgi:hypothetical protein